MLKTIKIIDILCYISIGEKDKMPKKVKWRDSIWEYDDRKQDLLHFIENNKINMLWCYKYVRELKRIREERRNIKNDMERINKFKEHKTKLASTIDNRQIMLAEINKREKQLNCPYKNRRYTEEEIQKVIKGV